MLPWTRPANAADTPMLLALYASTREADRALFGWSPAQWAQFMQMQFDAQARHYTQQYPQAQCQVVMWGQGEAAQPVGRWWPAATDTGFHVLDISLLPTLRGQGLGRCLLQGLLELATARQQPVSLSVELTNPARRLYERLGFQAVGQVQGLHQPMRWQPASAVSTQTEECSSC
jgi:ribosomal protein S18 acetylase RimI-like enzyme